MTVSLSLLAGAGWQFFDDNGNPLSGGLLYTYEAGTTTPLATYTDSNGNVANANPIVLDAAGRVPYQVWLNSAYSYKFILKTSLAITVWTEDSVPGYGSSADVTFLQAGTGAVARTVQSKLRDVVSVLDFGADPTGVADSTAAIQAALTAASGKTVVLSAGGTYKVTAGLSVSSNTIIEGYGATLSCTTSQFTALTFANGGACFGLTLIGPASGTYNANGIGIKCVGTNNAPAAPTFVNAPTIRDCTIKNFGIYGIYFSYVNGGLVEGCKISGIGYAGVGGVSCNDTVVTANDISTIGPGPGTGDAYGVFLDRNNGTSETAEPRSYRCAITNNDVRTVVATGGLNGQGLDTHGGVDFVFADNRITGCQVGIAVTSSVISATPQLGPLRVTISGNVINGLSVGYGILVSGAINGATVNEYAQQITVANNVVLNHGATNDSLSGGIVLQGTKGATVQGNTVRNARSVGINLILENLGINVSGNTITDPHDNTFSAPVCLRISGNKVTGYVGGNTFVYENAALNTYVAIESVRVASGLTNLDISFGKSSFVGIDATHLTFMVLTTTGVRYVGVEQLSDSGTISVSSGVPNGITDVTFAKRFPYTPKVTVTLRYPFNGGGKFPVLGIDTGVAISATGFRIYALPYDGGNWSATGSLSFDWVAE